MSNRTLMQPENIERSCEITAGNLCNTTRNCNLFNSKDIQNYFLSPFRAWSPRGIAWLSVPFRHLTVFVDGGMPSRFLLSVFREKKYPHDGFSIVQNGQMELDDVFHIATSANPILGSSTLTLFLVWGCWRTFRGGKLSGTWICRECSFVRLSRRSFGHDICFLIVPE